MTTNAKTARKAQESQKMMKYILATYDDCVKYKDTKQKPLFRLTSLSLAIMVMKS